MNLTQLHQVFLEKIVCNKGPSKDLLKWYKDEKNKEEDETDDEEEELWSPKSKGTTKLKRDQVDDLMPTIKEGGVIKELRARNDAIMVSKVFWYPSDCDHDKKIHIDCAYNLKFSCMIGTDDVIFGEPFLREVRINAKRFERMITIHNGNEEVTYQMA
nr:hypothetical protein [Tanacetum cinerariifolium]